MKDARCDMGNDKKRMQALKLGQTLEFANLQLGHGQFFCLYSLRPRKYGVVIFDF